MTTKQLFYPIVFLIIIFALVAYLNYFPHDKQLYGKNDSYGWIHLSSKNGDIPSPGLSKEQTASLIMDVDRDGLNDFIIGSRIKGSSLVLVQKEFSRVDKVFDRKRNPSDQCWRGIP
jgi:hypothetical protein